MRRILLASIALTLCAETPAEQRIRADLAFLASPALKGRGNGEPELDRAADYLVDSYRKLGLKAGVQRFPYVKGVERVLGSARIGRGDVQGPQLVWGRDIEAYGFSADGDLQNRPLAFVGYGMKNGAHDDLAGIDLKGKVALILAKVPEGGAFAHVERIERSLPSRVRRLQQAGAAAVAVLEEGAGVHRLQKEEGPSRLEVPVLSLALSAVAPWCEGLAERIAALKADGQPQSRDYVTSPWTFLDLQLKLKPLEVQLPNVVAEIPGRDPALRGEYIALGAHFDHLGLGERHSMGGEAARGQVHPGADDNASGTALVLELARQFRQDPPKRSLLLLHFSGEEEGVLGSSAWIRNPTVKLDSVKFMANFDMVGYLAKEHPKLSLAHMGAPKQALERAQALAPAGLVVNGEVGEMAAASDHISFSRSSIPTFFFFTGLHANYHRPSDTADRINVEGMATLTGYAQRVVADLADAARVPAFDPETAKVKTSRGGPMRVDFGVLPDYGEDPKGFRLQGVSPGKTAEAIGLKGGDIITAFGEVKVKGIYDYMEALGRYKGGDKVVVKWLREGKEMQAEAVLKGR